MINRQRQLLEDDDDVPELPPPSVLDYSPVNSTSNTTFTITSSSSAGDTSNMSRLRKARRLTSTPRELLGSLENVASNKTEFLNPNDLNLGSFNRGTRQTQSLRIAITANKRR